MTTQELLKKIESLEMRIAGLEKGETIINHINNYEGNAKIEGGKIHLNGKTVIDDNIINGSKIKVKSLSEISCFLGDIEKGH
ncbi:hypothetical protein [Enterococcus casseliflavus]|uniref:hypothetical protein n=1 Tax=Enterococcus casseliflavus TaxID=37734 RepID=UPI00133009F3|nr:hypothetical protein [Enterococcus casseliflavus]